MVAAKYMRGLHLEVPMYHTTKRKFVKANVNSVLVAIYISVQMLKSFVITRLLYYRSCITENAYTTNFGCSDLE